MRSIEPLAAIYRRWALARLLEWVDDEHESKTRGGFVDYVVNLHVEVGDEAAYAVASMDCPSGAFKGEGRAKVGTVGGQAAHRSGIWPLREHSEPSKRT